MLHAIMKAWHPMLGVDWHIPWPPGSPSPAPLPVPYRTVMVMYGSGLTCVYCPNHMTSAFGFTMARGTDIGPMIPHIGPPSVTLALEMLFSASKSHFGPRSYVEATNRGGSAPIAAALLGMTNPNLNCGTPCPTPTGFVMALNTHGVGMTMADINAGLNQMAVDMVVQTALFFAGGAIGKQLGGLAARFAPKVMSRQAAKLMLRQSGVKGRHINDAMRALRATQQSNLGVWGSRTLPGIQRGIGALLNAFGGSPLGASAENVGGPTAYSPVADPLAGAGDWIADNDPIGQGVQAISDYLNAPSVDDYPSTPPPAGVPDASVPDAGAPDAGAGDHDEPGGVCEEP